MALSKKQANFTIFIHGDYKIVTLFKTPALWPTSDVYQLFHNTHFIYVFNSRPPSLYHPPASWTMLEY